MSAKIRVVLLSFSVFLFSAGTIVAQSEKNKSKYLFKDSTDHAFDLSNWVLNAHGFIPIPMLITEPALGNIGGGLIPVFIRRNAPYIDTVGGRRLVERVRPNIYGMGAIYTANGTWLVGGAVSGVIRKWRAHYRIGGGYANVNLNFYKTLPVVGEQSALLTIRTVPIFFQFLKQISRSHWYAGANYLFLKTEFERSSAIFREPDQINRTVSRFNVIVEYDNRDNIFTPDKGLKWNTNVGMSAEAIGSDYNYQMANTSVFYYVPISEKLISGFRIDYQQVWNDVPFYLQPFINLRGIPVMRYQGKVTTLGEAELRWDVTPRWSALVFGGSGKAFQEWGKIKDYQWHSAGGAGFRYLIAGKMKLRMGFDLARGPEQWAYYMVFGTSWVK